MLLLELFSSNPWFSSEPHTFFSFYKVQDENQITAVSFLGLGIGVLGLKSAMEFR